jgi:hypothetical protein
MMHKFVAKFSSFLVHNLHVYSFDVHWCNTFFVMQILLVALSLLVSLISSHKNLHAVNIHVANKVLHAKQHFIHLKLL